MSERQLRVFLSWYEKPALRYVTDRLARRAGWTSVRRYCFANGEL